jgi:hypothetical protein
MQTEKDKCDRYWEEYAKAVTEQSESEFNRVYIGSWDLWPAAPTTYSYDLAQAKRSIVSPYNLAQASKNKSPEVLFGKVHHVYDDVKALDELISVQPMTGPSGTTFKMKIRHSYTPEYAYDKAMEIVDEY